MNNTETSLVKISLFKVTNDRRCPQCGNPMKEAERCNEGSITYVWFECAKADCDGQWWQSYINQMSVLFENVVV
jgi:hypothetical protein